jgi:hypothetical protein
VLVRYVGHVGQLCCVGEGWRAGGWQGKVLVSVLW